MIKRPLANIATISGAAGLIATGIFYYIVHSAAMASAPASSDETDPEVDRSRLWSGAYFPIDDHDGQELGRKIGDWVVSKIKDR